MRVAIDGPAGAGKSTVARAVAQALGFAYLDTGAMYRAVTAMALEAGVDLDDGEALGEIAAGLRIEFRGKGRGALRVVAGGRDITERIRELEVTEASSKVAVHPEVREKLVLKQKQVMAAGDWVAEGRDIGTVVAPDAEVKVFLEASAEERGRRRADELAESGRPVERESVIETQRERDERDRTREDSPLKPADDAFVIDTTDLAVAQVVDQVVSQVKKAHEKAGDIP